MGGHRRQSHQRRPDLRRQWRCARFQSTLHHAIRSSCCIQRIHSIHRVLAASYPSLSISFSVERWDHWRFLLSFEKEKKKNFFFFLLLEIFNVVQLSPVDCAREIQTSC